MAQNKIAARLCGNIVKVERKSGTMADDRNPGEKISWDYWLAKLLTPEFDAVEVRFPIEGLTIPTPDQLVEIAVEVSSRGGNLKVLAQAVAVISDHQPVEVGAKSA